MILNEIKEMRKDIEIGREEMKGEIRRLEEKWYKRKKEIDEKIKKLEDKLEKLEMKREGREKDRESEDRRKEAEEKGYVEKIREEMKEVKNKLEEKEKQERRNKIVVKEIEEGEEDKEKATKTFLKEVFDIKEGIKKIEIIGKKGRQVAVVELINWEVKQKIMKEKKKLRWKKIYIDHDLTRREKEVQRIIGERAYKE